MDMVKNKCDALRWNVALTADNLANNVVQAWDTPAPRRAAYVKRAVVPLVKTLVGKIEQYDKVCPFAKSYRQETRALIRAVTGPVITSGDKSEVKALIKAAEKVRQFFEDREWIGR